MIDLSTAEIGDIITFKGDADGDYFAGSIATLEPHFINGYDEIYVRYVGNGKDAPVGEVFYAWTQTKRAVSLTKNPVLPA